MNRTQLGRTAALTAALALGGGAGAGIYAAASGGTSQSPAVSTAVAPAQPAVAKTSITSLEQLYKNVTPGVVDITVTESTGSSSGIPGFPGGGSGTTQAEGTGFVYDTAGHIVTNAHVVDGASSIAVHFKDGKTAKATLVGADDSSDVAVLKVDVAASELHPLTLGSSAAVLPGEGVVAIGSPFGLTESMSAGIVSAINRTITAPNNYAIAGAIQTDAAINHGNSGGPLLDTNGDVIGVNAQIQTDANSTSSNNAGVGFALAIDGVKQVADTLIAGGKVQHAYLGVSVGDVSAGSGAQIECIVPGSPAAGAGLKAGDIVTAIGSTAIANADDLTASMSAHQPGDKVTFTVTRNGSTKTIDVTLGTRPSGSGNGCS
ncbi:MAG: S1C family serine protease [Gaiellaceae bacterium]